MKKSFLYIIVFCIISLVSWVLINPKMRFGSYLFEYSDDWNNGIPMNYFLFKEDDRSYAEYYVNDFKYVDDYVYYTVIDGVWPEDDCYFNPNLQFKRINLSNNQVEIINPTEYQEIYQKLSELHPKDKKWLDNPNHRCSVKFPEKWGDSSP